MGLLFKEMEPADKAAAHNVYFALRPDRDAAAALCSVANGRGRRRVDANRLHISLYSLGLHRNLPRHMIDDAIAAASTLRLAPFLVALDRLGSWGRGQGPWPVVAWADDGVSGVRNLHERLCERLAGVAAGRRGKPSIEPHLTLWRDVRRVPLQFIDPVRWQVCEVVLLDSLYGEGRHEVLGRWPLVG